MDVQRLVATAYPRLSRVDQEQMAMDHLLRALDNRALQRHMLTIMPQSVVDLVQSVDEYLAVGGTDARHPTVSARVVEAECLPSELSTLAKVVEQQNLLISKLLERVEALEASREVPRPPRNAWQPSPSDGCFQCGGPHWKRNCPQGRPSRQGQQDRGPQPRGRYSPSPVAQRSGNGGGPVQP